MTRDQIEALLKKYRAWTDFTPAAGFDEGYHSAITEVIGDLESLLEETSTIPNTEETTS